MLGIGIGAFVATNIDDLFILMAFFAKSNFPTSQVVLGQYVGMGLLLGVSLGGSLIALVIPLNLIGLIGLVPIVIGVRDLLDLRRKTDDDEPYTNDTQEEIVKKLSQRKWTSYLPFLTVATITFSGVEEIGIYTSIFVAYNGLVEIITIISVVMVLTGVWCGIAAYLVNRTFLAIRFRHISENILPFILIGLGIYILVEGFIVPIFSERHGI
jgi:cadmium resistance protein CadD (predicted permease)